jgi:hypothetical protein
MALGGPVLAALFLLAFLCGLLRQLPGTARLTVADDEGPGSLAMCWTWGQGSSILMIGRDRTRMIDFGGKRGGRGYPSLSGDFNVDEIDLMVQTHPIPITTGGMEVTVFRALKAKLCCFPNFARITFARQPKLRGSVGRPCGERAGPAMAYLSYL